MSETEEIPEARPRSDVDPGVELEVEGGTLVWKDPVVTDRPVRLAYLWPLALMGLVVLGIVLALS